MAPSSLVRRAVLGQWVSQGRRGRCHGSESRTELQPRCTAAEHRPSSLQLWTETFPGHKEMLSEVQRLLHQRLCLLFFWLSEPTLSCLGPAWKCSLSLLQGPLFCSSVTSFLHPSPAQPKVLLPKLLLFHIPLTTPYLLIPSPCLPEASASGSRSPRTFSKPCRSLYPAVILTAWVQPQKPFLALPFGFSFALLTRPCSHHSSC